MKKILYACIVIIVIAYGIAHRMPEVLSGNYLFGFDQGWNYGIIQDIVTSQKPRLIGAQTSLGSGFSGVFHGPGFYYLMTIPYLLWHGNPYGSIVVMALFGIATLIVSYFVGKSVFGRVGAVILTMLVAISPVFIPQSRFLWTPHPTSLLIILLIACIHKSYTNHRYIPISAAVAALVYHFHLAISIPLIISVLIYAVFFIRRTGKLHLFAWSILGIAVIFSPAILFEIRHGFMAFHGAIQFLSQFAHPTGHSQAYSFINHLLNYWTNFSSTFLFTGFFRQSVYSIVLFLLTIGMSLYYLYKDTEYPRSNVIKFLLLLSVTSWSFFLFLNNTIWDYYLIPLHFVYILLFTYVFSESVKFRSGMRILLPGILSIYLLNFFVGSVGLIVHSYASDFIDYGGTEKIQGKRDLVDYIFRDAAGIPFTILIFSPPVYTYPYDYIFSWYGKNRYGYIPKQEKSALTYLIIQPDGEKPWSYEGWLETVIKDGTIMQTTKLPSGFIIQKRSF